MRINPNLANQMYLTYSTDGSDDSDVTCLSTGTYTKLAAAKYIKDNDKDNDGALTSDEVSISEAAFAKLDADSDGKISKAEMAEGLSGKDDAIYSYYKNGGDKTHAGGLASVLMASSASTSSAGTYVSMAAKAFLAAKDADGDGLLTQEESGLDADVFSGVDADNSGSVSAAEVKSALSSKGSTIARYYKNGGVAKLSDLTSSLLKTI